MRRRRSAPRDHGIGRRSAVLLLALAALCATPAAGQEPTGGGRGLKSPGPSLFGPIRATTARSAIEPAEILRGLRSPPGAFVTSLVLPGAGQAVLGLRRWIVFGVAEAVLWGVRVDAVRDEARFSRGYRDLAWDVARNPGGAAREDGSWGYYEAMSHYLESGRFDADGAAPDVQPEPDEATYNGQLWALAVSLFAPGGVPDPGSAGYERALEYYEANAIGPAFLWSWSGHESELGRFRGLIDDADGRARRARLAAGLILANHLTSAVDALIAARLHAPGVDIENRIEPDPAGVRWRVGLRVPLPRIP